VPEPEQIEPASDAPVPDAPPPDKKRGVWRFLIVGVVLLAACVAGVAWMVRGSSSPTEAATPESQTVKSTLHLETFVINLADPDQKAYLRVGIDLGLSGELKQKAGEGGPPVALVRDTILTVLSAYKPDDLLTAAGKTKLKSEIVQALQQRVPELGVQEAYFTDFLVQR
jgi:flagellar basal body-associated protein FliL